MSKEHSNKIKTSEGPMVLTWEDGHELPFEHFDPKAENLVKVSLAINAEDMSEGIWACISDEDKKDYENDVTDNEYKRVAILRNTSLLGLPWGAYVPYKLNGHERPISYVEGLCGGVFFNMTETIDQVST